MCVIAVAILANSRWPLVIAANRDEFHARPTRALARWEEQPHILAGRDLQSGGTWLGVSELGRFAAVTNVKGPEDSALYDRSRGELVSRYLRGESTKAILHPGAAAKFAPFNLLTFDGKVAEFISNAPKLARRRLGLGVWTLSNALGARLPKEQDLKLLVENWLARGSSDPRSLLETLGPDGCVDIDTHLGDDNSHWENRQRQIFVQNAVHGTRCSTVATIDANGRGIVIERQFDGAGLVIDERKHHFSWGI